MKKIGELYIHALLLLVCSGFYACKKDKGSSNDVAKNIAAYSFLPFNNAKVYIPLNLGVPSNDNSGFPVLLKKAAGSDTEVTATIDTSDGLVREFDKLYAVTSPLLTPGLFKVSGSGKVTVKAGQTQSLDSIKIELDKPVGLKTGVYKYVVPLRLTSTAALASDIMFIRFVITVIDVINIDPRNTGLAGTTIDRSSWSITATAEDYGPAANVLDNDNFSSWCAGFYDAPQGLQLDMSSSHPVKGFSIVPNYSPIDFDFLKAEVFSSNDGVVWKAEGIYNGTSTASSSTWDNPDLKTIKFIEQVTARYFKFTFTRSSLGAPGLAELDAIE